MRIASFSNKFLATVAAVLTMLLAGTGVTSAQAASNAGSVLKSSQFSSTYTLGSTYTLQGMTIRSLDATHRASTIDATSLRGKAITFTAAVTGAVIGTSYANTYGYISWYSDANMNSYISQSSIYPQGGFQTPTSLTVPENAVTAQFQVSTNVMASGSSNELTSGSFTFNYTIKVDGISQNVASIATNDSNPTTGFYSRGTDTNIRVSGITTDYTSPAGTFEESAYLYACVDPASLSGSSVLTASLTNGGSSETSSVYSWMDIANPNGGGNAYGETADFSNQNFSGLLTARQILLRASKDFTSGGTRQWDLSIKDANNVEVSTPCAAITPTQTPTLSLNGSNLSVSAPTGLTNFSTWYYAIYRATDSASATPLYSGNSYYNNINMTNNASVYAPTGVLPISTPLVARYINKLTVGYATIPSAPGPVSNPISLPASAITVTSTISNGDDPGQAKLLTPTGQLVDYSSAISTGMQMGPVASPVSDGKEGFYVTKSTNMGGWKLYRLNKTGVDATFGGTGAEVNLYADMADPDPVMPSIAWFGTRDKWFAATALDATPIGNGPPALADVVNSLEIKTGTQGSGTVATTTLTAAQMNTFCAAQAAGSRFANGYAIESVSSPMAKPLVKIPCSVSYNPMTYSYVNSFVLASITTGANSAITAVHQFNTGAGNNSSGGFGRYSSGGGGSTASATVSVYPNASAATDTALAFYSVSYDYNSTAMPPVASVAGLKFVRVKMNGTATVTDTPVSGVTSLTASSLSSLSSSVTGKLPTLPPMSTGTGLVALAKLVVTSGTSPNIVSTTTWKLASLDTATGVFSAGDDISIDTDATFVGTSSLSFVGGGQLVGTTGQVLLQRYSSSVVSSTMTYVRGQAVLDLSSKQLDTGEAVTYTQPLVSGIFSLYYVDEQGRMNWLSTMDTNKFGWVRWNSTASNSSLPAGVTVTGQDSLFTVAAGGKLTITGTGLGTISAVTVGGNRAVFTKTATKLVVTLPKNLSGEKPVTATFPGSVVADLATITYVGAAKQAQTIAATTNVAGTWTGVNSKVTTLFPATTSVGLPTALKVDKTTVCSVAGKTVTMNAAGTCVVTVSSVGDLGTSAKSQSTSIVVAKGDLALSVASTLSVTNNSADISGDSLNIRSVNADVADAAADLDFYAFASSNENVCTVDEAGNVTGITAGSCVVTTVATAGTNWVAASRTTAVTVTESASEIPDVMPETGDGDLPAKAVVNNKKVFVATNDSSLGVKWDKAAGLLTLQAKGVYIGHIMAEVSFTKAGVTYTCFNVFGTTTALASKTAAQKKAALKSKVFTAAAATCKDASILSIPVSIGSIADFAKIKKVAKDKKLASNIVGGAKHEALALTKLKNFVGTVTIKVTRYRAWPTTMKNVAGAKKIPAVVRTTTINLQ
jgi:hypothetical protein